MSSNRLRWPGRALLVTTTPLIIAGCAELWTRPRAPRRPPKPRIAWAGPDAPRRGRTCWPAPPSSRRCWSTATFTKASCWPTAARLTGIIDWETARVDHPFWDFDLGEWGTGLWRRRRRDFSALWARGWRAYAQARGLEVGSGPLQTALRLRHALGLLADPGDPAVVGTIEEHLAQL